MKTTLATLSFLLGMAISQEHTECGSPVASTAPSHTVQFTPRMPVQKAPTSTVYDAIMTSYLNVVDCKYVMVQNVNDNLPQTGQFTARTTVPVLTVYRVGCMPETTAVTRRDFRGYDNVETNVPRTIAHDHNPDIKLNQKRSPLQSSTVVKALDIAERLASGIDPTNENITVREFKYLEQINTALFALNIVNSGFDLDQMCEYLRDADIRDRLEDNLINSSQASNIICFAAQYGLYFGMSNNELLADLAALEYAIQLHAYATKTLEELCEDLDYTAAGFLGIDTEGIRNFICNGTEGVSSVITPPTTSTTIPTFTGGYSPNTFTDMSPTGTVSIVYGTDGPTMSSAISAAGTFAPWFNTTVTETADVMTVSVNSGTSSPDIVTPAARPLFYTPRPYRRIR